MVPKADSGAFLLLFLLVLTVTEPLRPGARCRGWGRGRWWGCGRPFPRGCWTLLHLGPAQARPGRGPLGVPCPGTN